MLHSDVARLRELFAAHMAAQPEPTVTLETLAAETPPCDGCPSVDACRQGRACKAFLFFVRDGKVNESAKRVPSERLFHKLFRDDWSGTAEA